MGYAPWSRSEHCSSFAAALKRQILWTVCPLGTTFKYKVYHLMSLLKLFSSSFIVLTFYENFPWYMCKRCVWRLPGQSPDLYEGTLYKVNELQKLPEHYLPPVPQVQSYFCPAPRSCQYCSFVLLLRAFSLYCCKSKYVFLYICVNVNHILVDFCVSLTCWL